jgi:ADP-heptose:LPS heptosyltransferase
MINFSCRYYRASKPCVFNKRNGWECPSCVHVSEFKDRILFIKLDAIGDVLRSASLLPAIIARHQSPYIAWLTGRDSVELVQMMRHVDEVIELSAVGMCRVTTGGWDYVYSLSNDLASASIATAAKAKRPPIGYSVRDGAIASSNVAAERWLEMAAFDRLKRENQLAYQRHMLDIIGAGEGPIPRPALHITDKQQEQARLRIATLFADGRRPKVAINLGAGSRWPKKMLAADQVHALSQRIVSRLHADVLIVGGAAEQAKADAIIGLGSTSERIRVALTESSLGEFVALLNEMDALICGDTLALHVAAAVGLPTVAVFGPTSASEIEDFDGLIAKTWTPLLDCLVCYGDCTKVRNCMSLTDLDHIIELTARQLAFYSTRPATQARSQNA